MTESPLLTERQVSILTGLSLSTLRLYRYKCKGIPYVKVGRCVRYDPKDVHEFLEQSKVRFNASAM